MEEAFARQQHEAARQQHEAARQHHEAARCWLVHSCPPPPPPSTTLQAAATDANTPRRRRSSSSLTPTRTLSAEESAELETLAGAWVGGWSGWVGGVDGWAGGRCDSGENTPSSRRPQTVHGGASSPPTHGYPPPHPPPPPTPHPPLAALHLEERGALDRVSSWLERSIGCGSSGAGGAGRAAATSARLSSGYPEDGGADAAALPLGSEAEGSDGGGGSEPVLQEVLLPLVVGLQRMGRLPAAMKGLKSTQVARLKELLR